MAERQIAASRGLLWPGVFSPGGFLIFAAALMALYFCLYLMGLREWVSILSGALPEAGSGGRLQLALTCAYIAAHFAVVMVAPVLVLGAVVYAFLISVWSRRGAEEVGEGAGCVSRPWWVNAVSNTPANRWVLPAIAGAWWLVQPKVFADYLLTMQRHHAFGPSDFIAGPMLGHLLVWIMLSPPVLAFAALSIRRYQGSRPLVFFIRERWGVSLALWVPAGVLVALSAWDAAACFWQSLPVQGINGLVAVYLILCYHSVWQHRLAKGRSRSSGPAQPDEAATQREKTG